MVVKHVDLQMFLLTKQNVIQPTKLHIFETRVGKDEGFFSIL